MAYQDIGDVILGGFNTGYQIARGRRKDKEDLAFRMARARREDEQREREADLESQRADLTLAQQGVDPYSGSQEPYASSLETSRRMATEALGPGADYGMGRPEARGYNPGLKDLAGRMSRTQTAKAETEEAQASYLKRRGTGGFGKDKASIAAAKAFLSHVDAKRRAFQELSPAEAEMEREANIALAETGGFSLRDVPAATPAPAAATTDGRSFLERAGTGAAKAIGEAVVKRMLIGGGRAQKQRPDPRQAYLEARAAGKTREQAELEARSAASQ